MSDTLTSAQPWEWATLCGHAGPVELVSYPIPQPGRESTLMVRLKPGDPTSLAEVSVSAIEAVFPPVAHEWFLRKKVFYSRDPTVYFFKDELDVIAHEEVRRAA